MTITVGPRYYDELCRQLRPDPVKPNAAMHSFYGVQVHANSMFPYTMPCSFCNGTGEGVTSSICPKCGGQGALRVEGVLTQEYNRDAMTLITSPLPRKFDPSRWPPSVAVAPKAPRYIRSVPWPGSA